VPPNVAPTVTDVAPASSRRRKLNAGVENGAARRVRRYTPVRVTATGQRSANGASAKTGWPSGLVSVTRMPGSAASALKKIVRPAAATNV
jgi:hypothetical protein